MYANGCLSRSISIPIPSSHQRVLTQPQVFLNIVLDEAVEEKAGGEKVRLGMVVIRGNSVVMLEVSDRSSTSHTTARRTRFANALQIFYRHLRGLEATETEDRLRAPKCFAAAAEYGSTSKPFHTGVILKRLWGWHPTDRECSLSSTRLCVA